MRKAEGGRRKAEGGRRKAEGGRRKAEGGRRKAEGGTRVADIRREHRISEATFYIYGRLPVARRLGSNLG